MKPKLPSYRYFNVLRQMPRLAHDPNPQGKFTISGSDVLRFIIYAMGKTTQCERNRDAAEAVFRKARLNGVLLFKRNKNTAGGLWCGCDCVGHHARPSRQIRALLGKVYAGRGRSEKARKNASSKTNKKPTTGK